MTASFSRPWKPSTLPNSIPGKASFIARDMSASWISQLGFEAFMQRPLGLELKKKDEIVIPEHCRV
jgi:hypothetical protein